MSAREPVRVVFVTTVFEGVDTGPAAYAQYLWAAFGNDPDLEFHVVAPAFRHEHPCLHASGSGGGSLALYARVQRRAREVAGRLGIGTVVHGNSTHSMGRFVGYNGPWMVQVNDYETALFPKRVADIYRQHGVRRLLSFAWRYRHERRVLGSASLAVCNSEYTAETVRAAYGLDPGRLRVIHKAVDTETFRRPARLPPDPRPHRARGARLVFVGSDWQRKGLDVLLEALEAVARVVPEVSLAVIGPDPGEPALRNLLSTRRLADRVDLVGRASREAVACHLWHSDVFVLPTRREALGVAVLEALAAGLPVVAADAGGIPEIVRSGREGLLVPPERAGDLSSALRGLLADPVIRTAMAGAGRRRAEEFSVQVMVRALKETYRSLARTSGA